MTDESSVYNQSYGDIILQHLHAIHIHRCISWYTKRSAIRACPSAHSPHEGIFKTRVVSRAHMLQWPQCHTETPDKSHGQ